MANRGVPGSRTRRIPDERRGVMSPGHDKTAVGGNRQAKRLPPMPEKVASLFARVSFPEGDELFVRFIPEFADGNRGLSVSRQCDRKDRAKLAFRPPEYPPSHTPGQIDDGQF